MNKEEVIAKIGSGLSDYTFYPESVRETSGSWFIIGKDSSKKYLFVVGDKNTCGSFGGELLDKPSVDDDRYIKKASLSYDNMLKLKGFFSGLEPVKCDKEASFGTGDRLGMVTAAHIRAFKGTNIFPVIAQQSVRELERTGRTWQDAMASAVWGYFESGSGMAFGSDADHVKDKQELKKAADTGFTMFTADPSDHIVEIASLSAQDIKAKYDELAGTEALEKKYLGKSLKLGGKDYTIDKDILVPAAVKFQRAIKDIAEMFSYINSYLDKPFDFEVSMDEIEEPVTPLEHYLIASELNSAGVKIDNLALRYPGRWEKAIDFMGDLEDLQRQLKIHAEIAKMFGVYRLSLHSGSEKLSTFAAFSGLNNGSCHIKTAGTSYLEAVRTVSEADPALFKDIYALSLEGFEKNKASYHLTTDASKLESIDEMEDDDLKKYLDIREPRQALHVAFGAVLTDSSLKQRLDKVLFDNEGLHYRNVEENIKNHLDHLK